MTLFLQILTWIKDHWKLVTGVILLATSFTFGWFESKDYWQKPLMTEIKNYKDAQAKANAKIDQIQAQAKEDVKTLTKSIDTANSTIDDLSAKYKTEKEKKQKTIYVKDPRDPTKNIPIDFNVNGDQICKRFPDAYLETLNAMIKEANK